MDSRRLLPDEFREMVEVMKDADHEDMGGLTIHSGIHPHLGEIVIVVSREQDAVLIHG